MTHKEYWIEAVESSLDEHGLCATTEQVEKIASSKKKAAVDKALAKLTEANMTALGL